MSSEHHLTVPRTARYATLGGADGLISDVWLVCHGYGQLATRFIRHFEPIAEETRRVVAPEALSRFYLEAPDSGVHGEARVGASWMTREDRQAEINDYVEYLDALWKQVRSSATADVRLTALGFSQGGATAARWCVRGQTRPSRLVIWGGAFPRELLHGSTLERLRSVPLVLVAGTHDRYATEEAVTGELAALRGAGLDPEVVRFDGGHGIDAGVLQQLAASG